MLKMIKIKVFPAQNYTYVTYVSTILKFCLYCRDAYLSLVQLKAVRKSCPFIYI